MNACMIRLFLQLQNICTNFKKLGLTCFLKIGPWGTLGQEEVGYIGIQHLLIYEKQKL